MAVPSAGTFTASALQSILAKADEMWVDNMAGKDYRAHTDTLNALLENQRPGMFRQLEGEKDNTVKLVWLHNCDDDTASCSNDCTIGGTELSTNSKEYTLNLCRTKGFQVDEKALRSNVFTLEEVIAKGILSTQKTLDNWLNTQAISFLAANAGESVFFPEGWAQESGGVNVEVPSADFASGEVIADLMLMAMRNNFDMPYSISGELLWKQAWAAALNSGNAEGKGTAAMFEQMKRYHDLWAFDTANSPDKLLYLVNAGSTAFVSKAYYGDTPTEYMTQRRWSRPSFNLPVRYDWVYTNECSNNEITHKFSAYVKAGLFLNPTGCTETQTGILGIKKISGI